MFDHPVNQLNSAVWCEVNPDRCPCRGGWLLSDYDTWHRCQIHGQGVPHPEDEDNTFDFEAHSLNNYRAAYRFFRREFCRLTGMDTRAYEMMIPMLVDPLTTTPKGFVEIAEHCYERALTSHADQMAALAGFSCALEMRFAEEAALERAGC